MSKAESVAAKPPSEAYRRLFSIVYYEEVVEAAVETVLQHGRQLVGLAPLDRDEGLTKERMESEFATAEPFVAARLARTGIGFISMVLSVEEWSVIADSEQRPHRDLRPLHSDYDRYKVAGRAKVQVTSSSAPSASSSMGRPKSGHVARS